MYIIIPTTGQKLGPWNPQDFPGVYGTAECDSCSVTVTQVDKNGDFTYDGSIGNVVEQTAAIEDTTNTSDNLRKVRVQKFDIRNDLKNQEIYQ